MRILIVGAGGVGSSAALIAARRDFFEHLVVADYDLARATALVDRIADDRFAAAQVDAGDAQAVAALCREHGVTHVRYPYNYPKLAVDTTHPRYVLDHNRCILCSRCVRTCAEIEGAHVWDLSGRGIGSLLVSELQRPWGEATTCTSCGKCVQACPTGAMAEKGWGVEEMTKQPAVVSRLTSMRGNK